MPHREDPALTRLRRETAAHVAAARESNRDSSEHIVHSRRAISRSLELLSDRGFRRFF